MFATWIQNGSLAVPPSSRLRRALFSWRFPFAPNDYPPAADESLDLRIQESFGSILSELTVDRSGSVWQGGRPVGQLKLVDFSAREALTQTREGYFQASAALARIPADVEVHQGALEGSNVNAVDEMVAMIQTQRAFQRSARVVELVSKSYERLHNQ